MIRYDEYAEFQIARRGIDKASIEAAIRNPDAEEVRGNRRSFLKCFAGRQSMFRLVTPMSDSEYVITAYFDRTKPCA